MLLPIKPICPVAKMRQNGTSIIFLQYCQGPDRKTLLNTEIAIPPKFWNKKLNRVTDDLPTEYGTAKSVNLEIHGCSNGRGYYKICHQTRESGSSKFCSTDFLAGF